MYQLPIVAPGYGEEPPREEGLSRCLSNTCVIDKAVLTEALRGGSGPPLFPDPADRGAPAHRPVPGSADLDPGRPPGHGARGAAGLRAGIRLPALLAPVHPLPQKIRPRPAGEAGVEDGTLELENRLYFTQENVANRRGKRRDTLHMGYDKIKRVFETPRLIVLTTRRNRLIPLDKAGFANGGPEELYRLLTRKCPKLKTEGRSAHDPSR